MDFNDLPEIFKSSDRTISRMPEESQIALLDSTISFDSPDARPANDDLLELLDQSHTSREIKSNISSKSPALQTLGFFKSPESTPPDSSSGSSLQHPRLGSSDSSHSTFSRDDVAMVDEDQFAAWGADSMNQLYSSNDVRSDNVITATDLQFGKNTMENIFDFDSAASSPGPYTKTDLTSDNLYDYWKVPYRSSPGSVPLSHQSFGYRSVPSASPHDTFQFSSVRRQPEGLLNSQNGHPKMAALSGENLDETNIVDFTRIPNWSACCPESQYSSSGASSGFQPLANGMPIASSFNTPKVAQISTLNPALIINSINPKSRVETQIPVKLTLYPIPIGVTKLHIPRHSVAKAKQLAKTTPERSPEMLELNVELVCTSAMQDPVKKERALRRAACAPEQEKIENIRGGSGVITAYAADDPDKPSNGGCVLTCNHCMDREQRRADRKTSKKPEEDGLWMSLSSKRIVMFNSHEIIEWEDPGTINVNPKKKAKGPKNIGDESLVQADTPVKSSGLMEVSLPMRIGCYCRHQGEKIGFQVIFTIKDHEENLVAQAMTNSIMITDDHKSHAGPASKASRPSIHAENVHQLTDAVLSQQPPSQCSAAPVRHAHSATDLQGLRQALPLGLSHNKPPFNPTAQPSYTSPTAPAYQNLSRPVSPSAPSARHQKRRKGGASVNLPIGLIMTRLNTDDAPITPISDLASAGPSNGPSSIAMAFSPASYTTSNPTHNSLNSAPSRYRSGPPTESFAGTEARSQSMEDLRVLEQQNVSQNLAHSVHLASHVGTCTSDSSQRYTSNVSNSQHHAYTSLQAFQSDERLGSRFPVLTAAQGPLPKMDKLIPSEGSKSGGIEVTCLGSGFHRGLEVMFGEAMAITTLWSEHCLICLLPPAFRAGSVPVRFTHDYSQNTSGPTGQQIYFTYVDDDEPEIIKQVLTTLVRKFTGRTEDPGEIVRQMRNGTLLGSDCQNGFGTGTGNGLMGHAVAHHFQASDPNSTVIDPVDIETWLLKCLDLIDLDDSPFPPHLNSTGQNGQSLLHLGASLGYYRFVSALLARGAHPDLRDKNGMSPMHIASLNNHSRIVRKLRLAGGDPTLRSLRGYTPADMASGKEMRDLIDLLERSSLFQSGGATSITHKTRASSVASLRSLWEDRSSTESVDLESVLPDDDDVDVSSDEEVAPSNLSSVAISQLWVRSRCSSTTGKKLFVKDGSPEDTAGNDRFLAAATAWSAWRDQIATQVQQLQQSMHRTLPNLPMPTLPPMPNLPDYQDYPMVRRISSLVPFTPRDSKDNDYHWWELLRGTTAPPPYDELYPHEKQQLSNGTECFAIRSAGIDKNRSTGFDRNISGNDSILDTIRIGSQSLTAQQRAELMAAHAMKVKRLQNDRNLLLLWIPLFLLLLMAMFNPQLWHGIYHAFTYVRGQYQGRATV